MKPVPLTLVCLSIVGLASIANADSNATTCSNSTGPCVSYMNTSSGSAVNFQGTTGFGSRGSSQTGTGLEGKTSSGTFMHPGVEGESVGNNGGGDAAGAFGLNALTGSAPNIGAYALGFDAIYGEAVNPSSGNSTGIEGADPVPFPSPGTVDFHSGVLGMSNGGTGVSALSNVSTMSTQTYPIGLRAIANKAQANGDAIGVYAESDSRGVLSLNLTTGGALLLEQTADQLDADGNEGDSDSLFAIELNGDTLTTGTITTSGGTYARTRGSSGVTKMTYGARATLPVMEDDGEAHLAGGYANIKLDAALGDVVDRKANYLVFVTPEGDCQGLYVTGKTANGFVVRELQGGRSTIDFQYRIVAKPVDENGGRLVLAPPITKHADPQPIAVTVARNRMTPTQ